MDPTPATRKPRRSAHVRAALVAGMGLLAIAAVGRALVTAGDGDPRLAVPAESVAVMDAPAEPSTATLVEAPAAANAPVSNPFAGGAASAEAIVDGPTQVPAGDAANATAARASTSQPPATTANPFNAMQTPSRPAARAGAGATTAPAAPRGSTPPASREPGLLQTLMDNIEQPSVPARDTRAMDRLARRLDRAPMPEAPASAAGAADTASATIAARKPASRPVPTPTPDPAPSSVAEPSHGTRAAALATSPPPVIQRSASSGATPQKPTLRAMLDGCPASTSVRGQRCRRQMCERAGVDARRCLRH